MQFPSTYEGLNVGFFACNCKALVTSSPSTAKPAFRSFFSLPALTASAGGAVQLKDTRRSERLNWLWMQVLQLRNVLSVCKLTVNFYGISALTDMKINKICTTVADFIKNVITKNVCWHRERLITKICRSLSNETTRG